MVHPVCDKLYQYIVFVYILAILMCVFYNYVHTYWLYTCFISLFFLNTHTHSLLYLHVTECSKYFERCVIFRQKQNLSLFQSANLYHFLTSHIIIVFVFYVSFLSCVDILLYNLGFIEEKPLMKTH